MGRHALQHSCGAHAGVDSIGHLDQTSAGDSLLFRIGPWYTAVRYGVTHGHFGHAVSNGFDHAGGFLAEDGRQVSGVRPVAGIDVGEVDAHCLDVHQSLTCPRLWVAHILVLEYVSPSGLVYAYGLHSLPPSRVYTL